METSEHALNSSCGPQPTDSVPFEHRPKKIWQENNVKKMTKNCFQDDYFANCI